MTLLTDFPKLQCPFVRKIYPISQEDFRNHRAKYGLRKPDVYLVTPEVNPGFEWVFDDPETLAVEKLDGTNVKLQTENGRLIGLQNRLNVIDPLQILSGKVFIVEGVFRAIQKGYVHANAVQAGELIGPKVQSNPYQLQYHLWYPFEKAIKHLRYKSFHEHERTFENLSSWFKDYLKSRLLTKIRGYDEAALAEGVVFYNLRRKVEGKSYMAKLRRDMFDWYYSDHIRIEKEQPNV